MLYDINLKLHWWIKIAIFLCDLQYEKCQQTHEYHFLLKHLQWFWKCISHKRFTSYQMYYKPTFMYVLWNLSSTYTLESSRLSTSQNQLFSDCNGDAHLKTKSMVDQFHVQQWMTIIIITIASNVFNDIMKWNHISWINVNSRNNNQVSIYDKIKKIETQTSTSCNTIECIVNASNLFSSQTWILEKDANHGMTLLLSRFNLHNHHHLHWNFFVLKYANTETTRTTLSCMQCFENKVLKMERDDLKIVARKKWAPMTIQNEIRKKNCFM